MNRVLKFRAWSHGEMIYSDPMPQFGFWKWVGNSSDREVMQFTGLHDKNGKEIYEGDIVKGVLNYPNDIFNTQDVTLLEETNQVIFENAYWAISGDGEDEYSGGILSRYDTLEVLGNVFQHPHLIPKTIL